MTTTHDGASWWVGLSRDDFSQRALAERARLAATRDPYDGSASRALATMRDHWALRPRQQTRRAQPTPEETD